MARRQSKCLRLEAPEIDTRPYECFVCHITSLACKRSVLLPCCCQMVHKLCQSRWEENNSTCGLCRTLLPGRSPNTGTAPAFNTAAVKQIDPKVEMYIKRMRQLPTSLLVNADPKELKKALAHEEGDLVTPVQQKILKRLIHQSKEPRPPVKKEPASKQVPAPVVKRTPVTTILVEHAATPPPPPPLPPPSSVTPPPSPVEKRKSSWEELPISKMPSPGP